MRYTRRTISPCITPLLFIFHFRGRLQEIKAGFMRVLSWGGMFGWLGGVERGKFVRRFIEEAELGIFYIITVEGWKQASEDGKGRIILDRIVLREVVCRSWKEEAYELLYNVGEGKGFESMQVSRRLTRRESEHWPASPRRTPQIIYFGQRSRQVSVFQPIYLRPRHSEPRRSCAGLFLSAYSWPRLRPRHSSFREPLDLSGS
jgi:hypothetical protein